MKSKLKSVVALLLTVCLLVGLLPVAYAAEPIGGFTISQEETTENGVSKLVVSVQATGISILTADVMISYDNTVVVPVDSTDLKTEISVADGNKTENACFTSGTGFSAVGYEWAVKGDRTAFNYSLMSSNILKGTDISTSTIIAEFYFKVIDGKTPNKATFRIETAPSELLDQLQPTDNEAAPLKFSTADSSYRYGGTEAAMDESAGELTASISFRGDNVDALTDTAINNKDNLSLAVPTSGSAELQLSVTNTGLDGEYAGSDAETTWEITDGEETGAEIDKNSGVLKIDNTGRAGTVTVQATTKAGGVIETDTAEVTITRADSEPGTVTISGETKITVPANVETVNMKETYTVSVTDQFGAEVAPAEDGITWSIEGTVPTGVSINEDTGVLTVSSYAEVPAKITIKATVTDVTNPAAVNLLAEQSAKYEVSLVREKSVATTVEITGIDIEGYDVPVAAAQSGVFVKPEATVKDQYGDVMENASVTWSLTEQPDGIEFDSTTGMIAITTAVKTSCDLKLTVTVDGTSVTTSADVKINRAESVATEIIILRDEVPLDGADTVVKPAGSEPKTYEYFAIVMDQYDMPMRELSPTMTAITANGVSFEDDTLTVTSEAAKDTEVTITASYGSLSPVSVTVTITDVDVDWSAVDTAVSGKSLTYGQKNSELADLPAAGTASAAEAELEGTFSYKDGDTVQNAGSQKVTVVFTVTTDGEYKGVQVEKTYDVTVSKKAITVIADDKTKNYGHANPELTFTVPDGALVNGDEASVLTVRLTCTATETTGVGTVEITGTGTADNYNVTVTPGKLTISPATVTITTTAPTQSILANSVSNTVEGLKALLNLPATVNITGAGTAATTASITWADATEEFDAKRGTYTYVGTVKENANFANQPTLTATVTVEPVHVTAISGGESITVSKSQVANATDLDVLGVDDSVTLTYDNNVTEQAIVADWDQDLAAVQAAADTVTETSGDKSVTLTLTDANIPAWATVDIAMPQVTITITNKYVIPESDITFADTTITYGEKYEPSASVAGEDKYADVTYTYTCNGSETLPTDVGTYTITVTVENDSYKGTKSATLTINPKSLAADMLTITGTYTYTGAAVTPTFQVKDGEKVLVSGTDFTAEVTNNVNAGEATVTVTGQGNYQGTVSGKFTISDKDLADGDIVISGLPESVTYTGSGIEPQFTVTFGDIALVKGTDYTVTYSDNENAGTATVTISGQGNYTGTKEAKFTIAPAAAAGTVTISGNNYEVGTELTAEVSGDKHGTLTYQWYANGTAVAGETNSTYTIKAGDTSVYVVATSSGNYEGTLTSSAIEVGKTPIPGGVSLVVSGDSTPVAGEQLTVTVANAPEGFAYSIQWLRDGVAIPGETGTTYTLTDADKGHTISAKLVPGEGYTGEIVANQGVSVAATVPGKLAVTATAGDRTATIRWTVDDGGSPITQYKIQLGENTIYVDGGTTSYIFSGLSNGDTYKITVTAINAMGESAATEVTVMPKAPTPVDPGDDDDDDHHSSGGSSSSVTRYTITVEQNRGGEITPDTVRVRRGEDQTFRIRADEGYEIEDVLVDGESVGDVSRYTFENVRKAHTIEAIFRAIDEEEPGQSDRPFTDVDPNGWAAEYIYYLYDRGVVNGISTNQFAPTRSITRAEFVKMLAGVAGVADDELNYNSSSFTDVEPGSWYEPYVNWAVENGVTTGTSATTFSPTANITREQMAVMIYRFAQNYGVELPSGTSATFSDAASFSSWASEAIYAMQRAGIIDGVGGGRFAPADNATREQACKMLAVLMELM